MHFYCIVLYILVIVSTATVKGCLGVQYLDHRMLVYRKH